MRGWGGGKCGWAGHVWLRGGGACVGYDEIRSMSGRYASYWNAFLLYLILQYCLYIIPDFCIYFLKYKHFLQCFCSVLSSEPLWLKNLESLVNKVQEFLQLIVVFVNKTNLTFLTFFVQN